MAILFIDFETRCPEKKGFLKDVGAANYAAHPKTEVLLLGWALDYDPIQIWKPGQKIPFSDSDFAGVCAHNLAFDFEIYQQLLVPVGFPCIKNKLKYDTKALAAFIDMPMSLKEIGQARPSILPKHFRKKEEGAALLEKTSYGKNPKILSEKEQKLFEEYCRMDVEICRIIFWEMRVFIHSNCAQGTLSQVDELVSADFEINKRGVKIDTELLAKLKEFGEEEQQKLDDHYKAQGINLKSNPQFLEVLKRKGLELSNCQAETLRQVRPVATTEAQKLIDDRLTLVSKTLAKLTKASLQHKNGRLFDQTQIFGAHTKRWAGRGVQLQNLPRSKKPEHVKDLRSNFLSGLFPPEENWTDVVQDLMPTILIPDKNHKFIKADYASIELRILLKIAKETEALEAIRQGKDLYRDLAAKIFRVSIDDVTPQQRWVGKQALLGCGYGMGKDRFTALISGKSNLTLEEDADLAEKSVLAYRANYPKITGLWDELTRHVTYDGTQEMGVLCKRFSRNACRGRCLEWMFYYDFRTIKTLGGKNYSHKVRYRHTLLDERKNLTLWGGVVTENIVQHLSFRLLAKIVVQFKKYVVFTVHDEVVLSVPEEEVEEVKEKLRQAMTKIPADLEPILGAPDPMPLDAEIEVCDYYKK